MSSVTVEVVALALQRSSDKKYLVARRGPGQSGAGFWEFPGGKIEANETPQAALVREIEEELAFKINPNQLVYVDKHTHAYPEKKINLQLWHLLVDDTQPSVLQFHLSEHDQTMWCDVQQLATIQLSSADIYFLNKLL